MIYLYIYFAIYISLAVLQVALYAKVQRNLISMGADLPPEYLYFTTHVVPFTKKESVFWGIRKGRLNQFGPEIKTKVRFVIWLQNILLLMFLGPAIVFVRIWLFL